MLRGLLVLVLAIAIGVAFARTLSFGDGSPSPSQPARATPSATVPPAATAAPLPARGAVAVTISAHGVAAKPRTVSRTGRRVHLRVDNRAGYMIEFVLARGPAARLATRPAALKRAQIGSAVPVGTGDEHQDALKLAAGRYTVLARPLTEGTSPPARPIGYATIRVR